MKEMEKFNEIFWEIMRIISVTGMTAMLTISIITYTKVYMLEYGYFLVVLYTLSIYAVVDNVLLILFEFSNKVRKRRLK
jgi:uncharacterized membrane protein